MGMFQGYVGKFFDVNNVIILPTFPSRYLPTQAQKIAWSPRKGPIMSPKKKNLYMGVSENSGFPQIIRLKGFSIMGHPFWDTPIFGNTHVFFLDLLEMVGKSK